MKGNKQTSLWDIQVEHILKEKPIIVFKCQISTKYAGTIF